jgi:phosphoribosyl-ATP pyrophosphohydrolase/phosphoribosyl-AMP cyclohydrolase
MIDKNNLTKFFVKSELIPAVVQDATDGRVLMLAYMNLQSLQMTLQSGFTWFWSRSRQELWNKGATSGHVQKVVDICGDCDDDTLLITVEQTGVACHTGTRSCFDGEGEPCATNAHNAMAELFDVITQRKNAPLGANEQSYTKYLFDQGLDKILKKCGEECAEMIIAAKNDNEAEFLGEVADLMYHTAVLLAQKNLTWQDVEAVLRGRSAKIGNLKTFRQTDKET